MRVVINLETSEKIGELIGENETMNNFLRRLLGIEKDEFLRAKKYEDTLWINLKKDVIESLQKKYPMLSPNKAIRELIGLKNSSSAGRYTDHIPLGFQLPLEEMASLNVGEYVSIVAQRMLPNNTLIPLKNRFQHYRSTACVNGIKVELSKQAADLGRMFEVEYKRVQQRFDIYCVKILTEDEIEEFRRNAPDPGIINIEIPEEAIMKMEPQERIEVSPGVKLDEVQIGEGLKKLNDYLEGLGAKNNKRYRAIWIHKRSLFNVYCFDMPKAKKENGNGKYADDIELL